MGSDTKTLHLEIIGDDGSTTKVDIMLPIKVLMFEFILEIIGNTGCLVKSDGWKGVACQYCAFALSLVQQTISCRSQNFRGLI
jgi:hypothetical protein